MFRGPYPTEIGFEYTPIPLRFSKILALLESNNPIHPLIRDDPNLVEVGIEGHYEMFEKSFRYNLPLSVRHNDGPAFRPDAYTTNYLSNQASRFLHQYAASPTLSAHPFFLFSLTYTAPHIPLQALRSDYDSEEVAALGDEDKTVCCCFDSLLSIVVVLV